MVIPNLRVDGTDHPVTIVIAHQVVISQQDVVAVMPSECIVIAQPANDIVIAAIAIQDVVTAASYYHVVFIVSIKCARSDMNDASPFKSEYGSVR